MKVTDANVHKMPDGTYTIGPAVGKTFVHKDGIRCARALSQTEAQLKDWTEE